MSSLTRCDGITRRDWLCVGGLTSLGLGLGDFFRLKRLAAAEQSAKAKSCILIWLDGGPSHLESFDPKPDAPSEVRGPLASIPTKLAGIRVGECLELTAGLVDRIAIVRSMTSPLGEHNFGTHYLMTGYKPSPALEYPTFGATLAQMRQTDRLLPPHIAIPTFTDEISGNGYLPAHTAPFSVGGNPERGDFKVRDLDFYQGLNLPRLARRRHFVEAMDRFSRQQDAEVSVTDPNLEQAYNLIASQSAKDAFKLSDESDITRNRYGRSGGNGIGQSCLLARRLVERGVPFVTVNSSGWDTHNNIVLLKERYPGDQNAHLPALDRALSALVMDLQDRQLLDETLIVVMGEFGRTPRMNTAGGRDHWPNVFSVVLAGGGVRGGQIVGSSDATGEFPKELPVTPSDLAATIYHLLGVDPALELHTNDGRPVRVAADGAHVIGALLS